MNILYKTVNKILEEYNTIDAYPNDEKACFILEIPFRDMYEDPFINDKKVNKSIFVNL